MDGGAARRAAGAREDEERGAGAGVEDHASQVAEALKTRERGRSRTRDGDGERRGAGVVGRPREGTALWG
jgi:hypothetical protein